MIVYLNVLGPSVKDWVMSLMNIAHVIAIEDNRILDGSAKSFNILLSHTTSHATTVVSLHSTSLLDNATVGCFLLLQDMAPLPRENTNPEVDLLSAL